MDDATVVDDARDPSIDLGSATALTSVAVWVVLACGVALLGLAIMLALDLVIGWTPDRRSDLGWTLHVFRLGLVGLIGAVLVGLGWSSRDAPSRVAAARLAIASGVALILVPFVAESVPFAAAASPFVAVIALGGAAAYALEHRMHTDPMPSDLPNAKPIPARSRRDR